MSWLVRSITNSLRLDDDDNGESNNPNNLPKDSNQPHPQSDPPSPEQRGVKEDLSDLTQTLTRQFWGVASFLAPPPQAPDPSGDDSDRESSDAAGIEGIRSDIAEIGGKFKSGISKLSSNIGVSDFSKIASSFLQLGSEEQEGGYNGSAVGVTEEVVAFARDVAMHPETWMDFPLPEEDDDDEDFDMSDAQQEHALAVESLAPRLAALRIELCPGHMSEGCFWKIYFVLLQPRLNKHDADLLITPQIVEARASLTQELQNKTKAKPEQDWSGMDTSCSNDIADPRHEKGVLVPSNAQAEYVQLEPTTSTVDADFETEKHAVRTQSTEILIIDKSVVEEGPTNLAKDKKLHSDSSSRGFEEKYEDDGDDWLKEESSEIVGASGTGVPVENEEDVSFSDLEEDDGDVPTSYKKVTYGSDSSTRESRDWVQLGRSSTDSNKDVNTVGVDRAGFDQASAHDPETKESNDWLDVDEIDVE
ncbi:hypothetical protein RHGRI_023297 [Rhododendron griersonianum]|uniref:BSD domain-containing protein n=1 Tax=Rhododendron griersonianum TaxID=479676 RepID=A0AAV6J5C2_9ERIC|nr:hypothetical protein RHGRI_023297 [Rhododendron griersonianum]